jgi:hypothetical protein
MRDSLQSSQTQIFDYQLRHRIPPLLLLALAIVANAVALVAVSLSLLDLVTAGELFGGVDPATPGALLAGIIIPTLLTLHGTVVNLLFPAVQVSTDGFRISRLYYASPLLDWQDICDIKPHWFSWFLPFGGDLVSISVEGISPVYGFIGFIGPSELSGVRGFAVSSRMENYSDLMELLQAQRPDLFA